MDYKTIANDGIVEEEKKKSRLFVTWKRISSEEEGREYIAQIKKEHHKADHSCSAMIVVEMMVKLSVPVMMANLLEQPECLCLLF